MPWSNRWWLEDLLPSRQHSFLSAVQFRAMCPGLIQRKQRLLVRIISSLSLTSASSKKRLQCEIWCDCPQLWHFSSALITELIRFCCLGLVLLISSGPFLRLVGESSITSTQLLAFTCVSSHMSKSYMFARRRRESLLWLYKTRSSTGILGRVRPRFAIEISSTWQSPASRAAIQSRSRAENVVRLSRLSFFIAGIDISSVTRAWSINLGSPYLCRRASSAS